MMKRTKVWMVLTLLMAAGLMVSGPVFGQIAAPRMNSLQIESTSPFNPAVLPWSPTTRITLGTVSSTVTASVAGVTSDYSSGSGALAQMRLMGKNISINAEILNISTALVPAAGAGNLDISNSLVALSYQIGGWLSFGVGSQSNQINTPVSSEKSASAILGTGIRLWENFFFGYSMGNITESNSLFGESSRPVSTYGLAVEWREGPEGLHLEGYVENRGDTSSPLPIESEVVTGTTVEAVLFDLLFSFESISTKIFNAGGISVRTVDDSIASFGWLPEDGFTIGVTTQRSNYTDIGTGVETVIKSNYFNLGWMF